MEIFHTPIEQMQLDGKAHYNLLQICNALQLDIDASTSYLQAQAHTMPVIAQGQLWISQSALLHWMLVPEPSRCLSPQALAYAAELAKKTLQAWERAGWSGL